MITAEPFAGARYFCHEAMHTTFHLYLRGDDETFARSMAKLCFEKIDLLESHLSRFIEGSDISRINRLEAGETLYLSEECHQCLLYAAEAYALTGGLFDVSLGTRIAHRKSGGGSDEPVITGKLTIHPDVPAVTCEEPGRELDLGGIGKGFALDQLKQLLLDWDAGNAFLGAGASSLCAVGRESWPVDLSGDTDSRRILLNNISLSASGTAIQGNHIVHPAGPDAMPQKSFRRVWTAARTATLAEIWSTAIMLINPSDLAALSADLTGLDALFVDHGDHIETVFSSL